MAVADQANACVSSSTTPLDTHERLGPAGATPGVSVTYSNDVRVRLSDHRTLNRRRGAVSADSIRTPDTEQMQVYAYGGIRILTYPMCPVSVHTGPAEYP